MATFTQDKQPYGPLNVCESCGVMRPDHEDSDYSMGGCRFTPAMRKAQRLERMAPDLLAALEELLALGRQESIEDGELEAAQKAARAAIAKARGA